MEFSAEQFAELLRAVRPLPPPGNRRLLQFNCFDMVVQFAGGSGGKINGVRGRVT